MTKIKFVEYKGKHSTQIATVKANNNPILKNIRLFKTRETDQYILLINEEHTHFIAISDKLAFEASKTIIFNHIHTKIVELRHKMILKKGRQAKSNYIKYVVNVEDVEGFVDFYISAVVANLKGLLH